MAACSRAALAERSHACGPIFSPAEPPTATHLAYLLRGRAEPRRLPLPMRPSHLLRAPAYQPSWFPSHEPAELSRACRVPTGRWTTDQPGPGRRATTPTLLGPHFSIGLYYLVCLSKQLWIVLFKISRTCGLFCSRF